MQFSSTISFSDLATRARGLMRRFGSRSVEFSVARVWLLALMVFVLVLVGAFGYALSLWLSATDSYSAATTPPAPESVVTREGIRAVIEDYHTREAQHSARVSTPSEIQNPALR